MSEEDAEASVRLVRSAAALFRRQGYEATSVKQLLVASGTVAGSLYHHFPGGKEELAIAAVERAGKGIGKALKASLTTKGARAALDDFAAMLAASMDASDGLDGCPVAPIASEAPMAAEPLRRACAAQFASWVQAIADQLVEEGHEPGPARVLAQVALSAVEGAVLLGRAAGNTQALQDLRTVLPALLPSAQPS